MQQPENIRYFRQQTNRKPDAIAQISGSSDYPNVHGTVLFWQTGKGVVLEVCAAGLPTSTKHPCDNLIFAFHIHEGTSCTGTQDDPFADTGGHFNPLGCEHPGHAGDLPPLFSNNSECYMSVWTNRFCLSSVLGRTVIIHRGIDDFTTQPSGAAGLKMACGKIKPFRK